MSTSFCGPVPSGPMKSLGEALDYGEFPVSDVHFLVDLDAE
nr:hypothetical protein [Streptomyces sp. 846.5]